MKFRILKVNNRGKEQFEVRYFDEMFDNRGPRWEKVIWDEDGYCHFQDYNCTDTIEEAKQRAADFKEKIETENGVVVDEFTL